MALKIGQIKENINMLRYKNVPSIEFDLGNGYMVKADYIYNRDTEKYYVTLHIRTTTVNQWNLMGKYENVEFDSDIKSIKGEIAKYVTELLTEGFFKYYMDRTDYELKCFDFGMVNMVRGVE